MLSPHYLIEAGEHRNFRSPLVPRAHDVVFVGGGFRTISFLASNPSLLEKDLCVIEQTHEIGPGAFRDLSLTSNSNGASFFRHVDRQGAFEWIYDDPIIGSVANATSPVPLQMLAHALARLGQAIAGKLGNESILMGESVTCVNVRPQTRYPVTIMLAGGEAISSKVCVFGTGRQERLHEMLTRWTKKTWLSSKLLSARYREEVYEHLHAIAGSTVVILGCSHSAFAALSLLLDLISRLERSDSGYVPPKVLIVHRRSVHICYPSVEQARREQVAGREEPVNPSRDVCPDTGIVFRDSGLRGASRDLYFSVWRGELLLVKMHRVQRLEDCADLLDNAGMIVQALGYTGRVPEVRIAGECVRGAGSTLPLEVDDDGFVALPGVEERCHIAALRVDPTPRYLADNGAYGKNLYGRMATRIHALI